MQDYICFYTKSPFWAGKKPNIENITLNDELFTGTLSERKFEYKNDRIYLAFCKDGLIITQIKELLSKRYEIIGNDKKAYSQFRSEYLNYLNTIQLILFSAALKKRSSGYFKSSIIYSDDAFPMVTEDGGYELCIPPNQLSSISYYYFMGRYRSQYINNFEIQHDAKIHARNEIQEEAFDTCFEDLNKVIENIEAIQILSHINSAVSDYMNLNFRQSFVQGWFVIEYLINKKYDNILKTKKENSSESSKSINQNNVAKILTILEYSGYISLDMFEDIDKLRNKRNKTIHVSNLIENFEDNTKYTEEKSEDNIIDEDTCWSAFKVVMYLIKEEYDLDIKIEKTIINLQF